jgi:sugar/nucleoside kinase (ribokinase family)
MVNFISGRDVGLRALEKIRAEYTGLIYMDIHSLTLGLRTNGERYLRKPSNWKRYAACADYLQMNGEEYKLLTGLIPSPQTLRLFPDQESRKALLVTMGNKSTLAGYRTLSETKYRSFAVPKVKRPVDTTGCGDVFGAAFAAMILKGYSPEASIKFANLQASKSSLHPGIENIELDTLPPV